MCYLKLHPTSVWEKVCLCCKDEKALTAKNAWRHDCIQGTCCGRDTGTCVEPKKFIENWDRIIQTIGCLEMTTYVLVSLGTCDPLAMAKSFTPLSLRWPFAKFRWHEPKPSTAHHCHATSCDHTTTTCIYVSNHCRTSLLNFLGFVMHVHIIYIYTHIIYSSIIIYRTQLPQKECKHPRSLVDP